MLIKTNLFSFRNMQFLFVSFLIQKLFQDLIRHQVVGQKVILKN